MAGAGVSREQGNDHSNHVDRAASSQPGYWKRNQRTQVLLPNCTKTGGRGGGGFRRIFVPRKNSAVPSSVMTF